MDDVIYISVAIALPVQKAYTYSVPQRFEDSCLPGVRVLVPFGKKRVTGYILGLEKPCSHIAIKHILDVPDDHPLFPESAIPFFRWISNYYLHPLGEVIKAALPSGLESHDESCLFATQKGLLALAQKSLTPAEEEIIGFTQNRAHPSLKLLVKTSKNPSVHALVRKMEKKDLISLSCVLKKETALTRTEKFIRFENDPDQNTRLSKKREKLLGLVKEKHEISLTSLKAMVPTAPSLIRPLSEAGFIRILQREVFRDPLGDPVEPDTPPVLTTAQAEAVKKVRDKADQGFSAFLLTGITGSGKTEVYMRLVSDVIEKEKKAIVLVPEIALISQTERRFRARFGERVAVIHSSLSKGELLDQWRKISLDKVDIVIGARSAVFAPFDDIGIIIVDEEHDTSYKQETGLRYNARDLAVVRAKLAGCPVLLGSATPSLQSYHNVIQHRFEELKLESRINQNPLPDITLVDLKKYKDGRPDERIITPELSRAIRQCLDKGNQALIFLNRRGFATFPVCRDCGKALICRFCDITMTLHKTHRQYRCHLCGYGQPVETVCPECGSKRIQPLGFGTEKIESMMKERFPDARIARMDQDTTSKKGEIIRILKSIRNRTVDLVVGTQMLAKGHDFPSITLVGVVCADLSLSLPDFRAGERTFQLLAQVAGRAGRGDSPGRVIMQTYNPDHFIIEASCKQDFREFFFSEIPFRKALMYPPFSRMTQLRISGGHAEKVKAFAETLSQILCRILENEKQFQEMIQVLGPAEAPIQKISSRFRWQILIKSPSSALVNQILKSLLDYPEASPKSGISLTVDVDPYFLM